MIVGLSRDPLSGSTNHNENVPHVYLRIGTRQKNVMYIQKAPVRWCAGKVITWEAKVFPDYDNTGSKRSELA